MNRWVMGVEYDGTHFCGWQQQPGLRTVEASLAEAISLVADHPVELVCGGRTDAGVHAAGQVVHFDASAQRSARAWVLGTNGHLDRSLSVSWAHPVADFFHARFSATRRHYRYTIFNRSARSALHAGRSLWVQAPLEVARMQEGGRALLGEHDFSAFRAAECQAPSPVKTLRHLGIARHGAYWRFDFDASAFLHHMVRNIMGCLVAVGTRTRPPGWMREVLQARSREAAAPTFAPDGLHFLGPYYDAGHAIPEHTPPMDGLP